MVRDSLLAEGLKAQEFAIVPLPIQEPGSCRHYVPEDAVHFVRVYSAWEEEKIQRLRAHRFAVEILDPGKEKVVSGTEVRSRLRSNLPWEHPVPAAVIPIVQKAAASRPQYFGAPTQYT